MKNANDISELAGADDVVLDVKNLNVQFNSENGTVYAVNELSLSLKRNQSIALIGESGSGKSVTMQAIVRLLKSPPAQISADHVWYQGKNLLELSDLAMRKIRGQEIAMIFQDPMSSLNPVLSIGQQLTEAVIEHEKIAPRAADARAIEMLELVGIANPQLRMKSFPHQFSGGQLQRICIAMALIGRPSILIADEPTTALDVTIQAQIVELVVRLQKQFGMSVIWITHDISLVAGFVDRVLVMYAGNIVENAKVGEIFTSPAHPYTRGLLNSLPSLNQQGKRRLTAIPGVPPDLTQKPNFCAFSPRCDFASSTCSSSRPVSESKSVSSTVACWHWKTLSFAAPDSSAIAATDDTQSHSETQSQVLLSVRNLKVYYPVRRGIFKRQVGNIYAVDDVSFDIHKGETLALVGESGCGKSTTGRAILNLEKVTDGAFWFNGTNYANADAIKLGTLRRHAQLIFQNPFGSLNPRMKIGSIISEGLRSLKIGTPTEREARVRELLALVGLREEMRWRFPHELSGGQRQRVGIARALAANPEFIIADEPISALDVSIQAQIINLLDDLRTQLGLTYLFIGHDLSMIRYFSHRVAVMYLGRIVEIGPTAEVFGRPLHPYTQALIAAIPEPDPSLVKTNRTLIQGGIPDPSKPPSGCSFHPRCPRASALCKEQGPMLQLDQGAHVNVALHQVACHHPD